MQSCSYTMLLIIITVLLLISSFAKGGHNAGSKSIVKSIKVNDAEIIDCINIYKQPAFSHPLLKNHTLQIRPTMNKSMLRSKNSKLKQFWHKHGRCPYGSIPIQRQLNKMKPQFITRRRPPSINNGPQYHQHATIKIISPGSMHGGLAKLNVWNPTVMPEDFSLAQIWVVAGSGTDLNTIEAGWHVYPSLNGDNSTRLFIYWTKDGYGSTGCYNLECPGFVQTNAQFLFTSPLDVSTSGGQQIDLDLRVEKEPSQGNWWLYIHDDNPIGYWPGTLFTSLANTADYVEWGGEVYDSTGQGGLQSSTQMGSGHFSKDGFQRASYIHGIKYINTSGSQIEPRDGFLTVVTTPKCYDLNLDPTAEMFLFFGGPGCQPV